MTVELEEEHVANANKTVQGRAEELLYALDPRTVRTISVERLLEDKKGDNRLEEDVGRLGQGAHPDVHLHSVLGFVVAFELLEVEVESPGAMLLGREAHGACE